MKVLKAALLLSLTLGFHGVSSAQTPGYRVIPSPNVYFQGHLEPVSGNSVKILGRGLQVRGQTNGIALSCLSDDCLNIRFIYISKEGGAYYVGPTYQLDDQGQGRMTEAMMKKRLKKITNSALSAVDCRSAARGTVVALGTGISAGVLMLSGVGAAPLLIFFGATALVSISDQQSTIFKGIDFIGGIKNNTLSESKNANLLNDQNGWNWSTRPKKISFDKFMDIQHGLFKQQIMWDF